MSAVETNQDCCSVICFQKMLSCNSETGAKCFKSGFNVRRKSVDFVTFLL